MTKRKEQENLTNYSFYVLVENTFVCIFHNFFYQIDEKIQAYIQSLYAFYFTVERFIYSR